MSARRATTALRVVVLGYIVRGPLGGMAWSNLQYLAGLAALGHEVWYVEDSDDWPGCYDPQRHVTDEDPRYGLGYAQAALDGIGLGTRWAYHDAHAGGWRGPAADGIRGLLASADLLLDLCGVNPMRPWFCEVPVRVLVDEDPVFTQVRHLTEPAAMARARCHNAFFTFAEAWGRPGCAVPDDGLPWRPTRQPLVPTSVKPSAAPPDGAFSTVMQWDSYAAREHAGQRYGMKSDSFSAVLDLPARVPVPLELALGGASAPRERLRAHGWRVVDPLVPTRSPASYLAYIAASAAEFSVAKQGYVVSRSGWFSERSVAYLASGRPVLLQDTGFSELLPCGDGLLPWNTADEAAAAIETVRTAPARHGRAARALAVEAFDARRVLPRLIDEAHAMARDHA